ncbi:MAG: DUF962 domain-containing protein [Acidobacteriota bacterium]|nr:DUF962 domain-containing protein [Acidobacteriota bacterium]
MSHEHSSDKLAQRDWVGEYSEAHRHPMNRLCHSFGIPMIVVSLLLAVGAIYIGPLWIYAVVLFVLGWVLQFVGHWFEGKPPEFIRDPRFLFVGVRWWFAKMRGKA